METPKRKSGYMLMSDFDLKRDSIVDYANNCQTCFDQLVSQGSIPSETLRMQLLSHFESKEDYTTCRMILNLSLKDEPLTEVETLIHEHESHLNDCYEVINEFGRLCFYGRPKEQGLRLVDCILENLSLKSEAAKILKLISIREELISKGCGSGNYYSPH
jgi:hypothetical protein